MLSQSEAFVKSVGYPTAASPSGAHRVTIATGTELPDRFTLVIPPLAILLERHCPATGSVQRFGSERYLRICGVNGLTKLTGLIVHQYTPNPSLHSTCYSGLRPLPQAGELKR